MNVEHFPQPVIMIIAVQTRGSQGSIRICFSALHDLPLIQLGIAAALHEKMIFPISARSQEQGNSTRRRPYASTSGDVRSIGGLRSWLLPSCSSYFRPASLILASLSSGRPGAASSLFPSGDGKRRFGHELRAAEFQNRPRNYNFF